MRKPLGLGSFIIRQEILDGKEWIAYPVRVVADTDSELALYLAQDTPMRFGRGPFTWGAHPWSAFEPFWQSEGVLQVQRPGDAYAVWMFQDKGQHTGCYINFQAPFRRTAIGVSTLDHELDMWIPADGGPYRWKDVDEFEELAASGGFTAEEAMAIRAEAEKVRALVESGDRWWAPWTQWTAPTEWTAPDSAVLEADGKVG